MTPQRRAVADVVAAARDHPTAEQIHERVRRRIPSVSLGTVYRNLNVLAEAGEIVELVTPGDVRHYDVNDDGHDHMVCTVCGAITEVHLPPGIRGPFREFVERASGYRIEGGSVEVQGVCPECLLGD